MTNIERLGKLRKEDRWVFSPGTMSVGFSCKKNGGCPAWEFCGANNHAIRSQYGTCLERFVVWANQEFKDGQVSSELRQ